MGSDDKLLTVSWGSTDIELIPSPQQGADLFLRSAGRAIMDFIQQNPTWDMVIDPYKAGIYLMAKEIWVGGYKSL